MQNPYWLVGIERYEHVFTQARVTQPGDEPIDTVEGHNREDVIVSDQTKLPRCWATTSAADEVQSSFGCGS